MYSEGGSGGLTRVGEGVSIPFKRESGFRESYKMGEKVRPETGKWEVFAWGGSVERLVSIPFKRESGFRDGTDGIFRWMHEVSIPFKRESGFRDVEVHFVTREELSVSIPFKRESGFREKKSFWSNARPTVSIPFKRESGFRA